MYHYEIENVYPQKTTYLDAYAYDSSLVVFFNSSIRYILTNDRLFFISIINSKTIDDRMVYKVSHNIIFIFEKQTNILKYIIAPEKKFLIIQNENIHVITSHGTWKNNEQISNASNMFIEKNSLFYN